jgi:hypothetical protein
VSGFYLILSADKAMVRYGILLVIGLDGEHFGAKGSSLSKERRKGR